MGEWKHPYPPAAGAYPGYTAHPAAGSAGNPGHAGHAGSLGGAARRPKYWPPVRRIDQAYGDRHLVCACPPPEAFE